MRNSLSLAGIPCARRLAGRPGYFLSFLLPCVQSTAAAFWRAGWCTPPASWWGLAGPSVNWMGLFSAEWSCSWNAVVAARLPQHIPLSRAGPVDDVAHCVLAVLHSIFFPPYGYGARLHRGNVDAVAANNPDARSSIVLHRTSTALWRVLVLLCGIGAWAPHWVRREDIGAIYWLYAPQARNVIKKSLARKRRLAGRRVP